MYAGRKTNRKQRHVEPTVMSLFHRFDVQDFQRKYFLVVTHTRSEPVSV